MNGKFIIIAICVLLFCLSACKKQDALPSQPTIVGKWLVKKRSTVYIRKGQQVRTLVNTNYTLNDFAEYFRDGNGVLSANTPSAIGISKFSYMLNGTDLIQYNSGETTGIHEKVTLLTDSVLSIHYEIQVVNPDDFMMETEKDDFDFKKVAL